MNKINKILKKQGTLRNKLNKLDDEIIKCIFETFPQIQTLRYTLEYNSNDEGGTFTSFQFDSINSEYFNAHNWEEEELSDDEKESLLKLELTVSEVLCISEALSSLNDLESYASSKISRKKFINEAA